jgi:two-component system, NarL family, response regulator LiaR
VEQLTEREFQVLKLLIEGLNNQQIADCMIISLSTVKTHISHIYAKLGATNRVEAARIAYERGLIQ